MVGRNRGFFDQLLREPFQWEDGYLVVPERPGLGYELDGEALRNHAVG